MQEETNRISGYQKETLSSEDYWSKYFDWQQQQIFSSCHDLQYDGIVDNLWSTNYQTQIFTDDHKDDFYDAPFCEIENKPKKGRPRKSQKKLIISDEEDEAYSQYNKQLDSVQKDYRRIRKIKNKRRQPCSVNFMTNFKNILINSLSDKLMQNNSDLVQELKKQSNYEDILKNDRYKRLIVDILTSKKIQRELMLRRIRTIDLKYYINGIKKIRKKLIQHLLKNKDEQRSDKFI